MNFVFISIKSSRPHAPGSPDAGASGTARGLPLAERMDKEAPPHREAVEKLHRVEPKRYRPQPPQVAYRYFLKLALTDM
jgi:hypothetical protein